MKMHCNCRKIDITPGESLYLAGYANRVGPSTGVHMALSSRCLIFRAEGDTFCIITNDFMELKKELVKTIKEAVSKRTSIPSSHIFIHSIHSHSTPIVDGMGMFTNKANKLYQKWVIKKIIMNTIDTYENKHEFRECNLKVGKAESSIAANRRYLDEITGKVIISTRLNILEDPSVGILQFIEKDGSVMVSIVNYACHPVSLGSENNLISPDFVGSMRKTIEDKWGGVCLFLNGAAGDINPRDESLRDIENTQRLGVSLGKSVLDCSLSGTIPKPMNFAKASIELPFKIKEISEGFIRSELKNKKEMQTGFMGWEQKIDQWALEQRKRLDQSTMMGRIMEISVIRMGGIVLIFSPGELFSSYHSALRKEFPNDHLFLFGYTNGESGYVPDEKAFEFGGYEVEQAYIFFNEPSALDPSSADILLKHIIKLVHSVTH